jgi:hypothetical protein
LVKERGAGKWGLLENSFPGRSAKQIGCRYRLLRRVARSAQKGVGLPVVTKEKASRPASGFYGVSAKGKRWNAKIRYDSKNHNLGSFDTEQEAALAYDREARQCRVERRLNYDSIEAAEEAAAKAQAEHSLGAEEHADRFDQMLLAAPSDPHGVNCESIKAAEEVAVQAQAKQQDILV